MTTEVGLVISPVTGQKVLGVIFCEDHRRVEKELIDEYQPTYNGKLTSKFYY